MNMDFASHLSRHRIAGFLAGGLDLSESRETEMHVYRCAHCTKRLESARIRSLAFAREFPDLETLAARVARGKRAQAEAIGPSRPPLRPLRHLGRELLDWSRGVLDAAEGAFRRRPGFASLVFLGAVGLLLAARMNGGPAAAAAEAGSATEPAYSSKGSAGFYLFRNGRQIAESTLLCKPSDTLQLGITSPQPVHYALLYKDDEGEIGLYLSDAGKDEPLGKPSGQNLSKSLILDQGWHREILFCVWSKTPFTLEEAKSVALASLDLDFNAKGGPAGKALHLQTYVLMETNP